MNFHEIKIHTNPENIDNIGGQLVLGDILGYEIIDETDTADFLRKNVNNGTGYADYVEDSLLTPSTDQVIIKIYLEESDIHKLDFIKELEKKSLDLGIEKIETTMANSADWENKWREYYKPMEIGQDVVIVPVWETYTGSHKKVFTIEPGHLFGTGLHQSTQGCIEQIEKYAQDQQMLDLGCGTGVLAIISLLCGATHATGIDIEATAPKIVGENAKLNNVSDKISVHVGNIIADENFALQIIKQNKKYGLITANIVADVIIAMLSFVKQVISNDGKLVMAGIIKDREQDVKRALADYGFAVIETTYKDDWVCIVGELG